MNWIPQHEQRNRDKVRLRCGEHGWRFLEPPLVETSRNDRLVVGLAMWSNYDIEFIEKLGQSALFDRQPIELFDMEDVRTEADFQQFIPGGHLPLRTPVVGIIRNGGLADQIEGDFVLAMSSPDLLRLLPDPVTE